MIWSEISLAKRSAISVFTKTFVLFQFEVSYCF